MLSKMTDSQRFFEEKKLIMLCVINTVPTNGPALSYSRTSADVAMIKVFTPFI